MAEVQIADVEGSQCGSKQQALQRFEVEVRVTVGWRVHLSSFLVSLISAFTERLLTAITAFGFVGAVHCLFFHGVSPVPNSPVPSSTPTLREKLS